MRVDGSGELESLRRAGAPKPPERPEKRRPAPAGGEPPEADAVPGESVEFSEVARVLAKLANSPPIRADKVDEIRAEIERGGYVTRERLEAAVARLLDQM